MKELQYNHGIWQSVCSNKLWNSSKQHLVSPCRYQSDISPDGRLPNDFPLGFFFHLIIKWLAIWSLILSFIMEDKCAFSSFLHNFNEQNNISLADTYTCHQKAMTVLMKFYGMVWFHIYSIFTSMSRAKHISIYYKNKTSSLFRQSPTAWKFRPILTLGLPYILRCGGLLSPKLMSSVMDH